jgi:hypothetical protein
VKQAVDGYQPSVIDLQHSSEDEICGDEFDDLEQEEDGEGKDELPGMPEDQDDSDLAILVITYSPPPTNSSTRTPEQQAQDFKI